MAAGSVMVLTKLMGMLFYEKRWKHFFEWMGQKIHYGLIDFTHNVMIWLFHRIQYAPNMG